MNVGIVIKTMSEFELNRELRELKKENDSYEAELSRQRQLMAQSLKEEMGRDMMDVLSGKVQIKLSLWERIKYKIRFYLDKLFEIF